MKTNLLLLVLILLSFNLLKAQVNVINTGEVGMGLTNPTSQLELGNQKWLKLNSIQDKAGLLFYECNGSDATDVQYGGRIFYDGSADALKIVTKQNWLDRGGISIQRTYGRVGIYCEPNNFQLAVGGSIYVSGANCIGTNSLPSGYKLRVHGGRTMFSSGALNQLSIDVPEDLLVPPYIWGTYDEIRFKNHDTYEWNTIKCKYCTEYSDVNAKKNIVTITTGLDKVLELRGVNYKWKTAEVKKEITTNVMEEQDVIILGDSSAQQQSIFNDDILLTQPFYIDDKTHSGLIAQEVEKVIPEAVVTDESGEKMISYSSIIPYLVEAIKEQQTQIETLKAEIESLKSKDSKTKSTAENNLINSSINSSQLFQNQPNPFSENTYINYFISDNVNKAIIYIYDLQGSQVKAIPVNERGQGSAVIYGSELYAGTYHYTLITDGQIIGTYTMILTN